MKTSIKVFITFRCYTTQKSGNKCSSLTHLIITTTVIIFIIIATVILIRVQQDECILNTIYKVRPQDKR